MIKQPKINVGTGRTFLTGAAILLLMAMGCDNTTSPNQYLTSSNDVLASMDSGDAVNAGHETIYTTDGFYFLAPMVKDSEYSGIFDGGLSPVVEICETTTCENIHASYDMYGEGSEQVRVDEDAEHYIVNWNARSSGAEAGQTYRIRVMVDGIKLGHANVYVVRNGREANQYQSEGEIAIVANQTLPVKFRIETGIVGSIVVEPAEATIEVGETQQFTATLYDLHGEPLDGPVVMWLSDDTDVATVGTNGLATGEEEGEATITASAGPMSGTALLMVLEDAVEEGVFRVPAVTVTSLGHRFRTESDYGPEISYIQDAVRFDNNNENSFGTYLSEGFTASIGSGETIVVRIQAPIGSRFQVTRPDAASSLMFFMNTFWQTNLGDRASNFETANVNFENLIGNTPEATYTLAYLSNAGQAISARYYANVDGDISFTAVEFRFTVSHSVTAVPRTYRAVGSSSSPSFGIGASGADLEDATVMAIVPIP